MDITVITARLAGEYSVKRDITSQINETYAALETQEKRLTELMHAKEFNTVQINLLEVLVRRPDGVKIEAVKNPPFVCGCPKCNSVTNEEEMPTPAKGDPSSEKAPVKRRGK